MKNNLPLVLYRFNQRIACDEFVLLFQNDFELFLCASDLEAQSVLKTYGNQLNAIFVEQESDYTSFLEACKAISPESLRILLHPSIALDDVVLLLEQGAIDKCFVKPYDANVIRSEIYATHLGVLARPYTHASMTKEGDAHYALIVDDESLSTHYLKKQLDALNCPCEIIVAIDAAEALALFHRYKDSIAIVMTDQRMPGMLGNQLLSEIRHHNPNIIRILTSAYEEVDVAINAVNEGQIFRYIKKPWDAVNIRDTIETALEEYLSKQGQLSAQKSLLNNQFKETLNKRKQGMIELLADDVDSYGGDGCLDEFMRRLMAIETAPLTVSSLKASTECSLEAALISAFSKAMLRKLANVPSVPDMALIEQRSVYDALVQRIKTIAQPVNEMHENAITEQLFLCLKQLLVSSDYDFDSLDFSYAEGDVVIKSKEDKPLLMLKHLFSPLLRITPQLIEQQSALLMLSMLVRHLGGTMSLESGKQQFSFQIQLGCLTSMNDPVS